ACWPRTRLCGRPRSCQCPTCAGARRRPRWWCCGRARRPTPPRCAGTARATWRPSRSRALSTSSRACRTPPPGSWRGPGCACPGRLGAEGRVGPAPGRMAQSSRGAAARATRGDMQRGRAAARPLPPGLGNEPRISVLSPGARAAAAFISRPGEDWDGMSRHHKRAAANVVAEELELELDDMAFGGEALGHADGQVVFVPYAIPGERVRVAVERPKKGYARTRLLEILHAAPERRPPPCTYFGACGGCQWQHVAYPAQLAYKQHVVVEQLRRLGGFEDAERYVRPTLGMVSPWEYRNQARFSLGRRYGELGFTRKETHRLLRIDYCWLMMPPINRALDILQRRCAGLETHQVTI